MRGDRRARGGVRSLPRLTAASPGSHVPGLGVPFGPPSNDRKETMTDHQGAVIYWLCYPAALIVGIVWNVLA